MFRQISRSFSRISNIHKFKSYGNSRPHNKNSLHNSDCSRDRGTIGSFFFEECFHLDAFIWTFFFWNFPFKSHKQSLFFPMRYVDPTIQSVKICLNKLFHCLRRDNPEELVRMRQSQTVHFIPLWLVHFKVIRVVHPFRCYQVANICDSFIVYIKAYEFICFV